MDRSILRPPRREDAAPLDGEPVANTEEAQTGALALPRLILGNQSAPLGSALGQSGRFEIAGIASDADSLIELVEGHQPELALLDILIPGDGLRATEGIAQVAPDTAVVVHSADEHRPTVVAFLQAGATYHVRSDTGMSDLADLLHRALEAHRR